VSGVHFAAEKTIVPLGVEKIGALQKRVKTNARRLISVQLELQLRTLRRDAGQQAGGGRGWAAQTKPEFRKTTTKTVSKSQNKDPE
jgi:hypothetical protein